MPLPSPQQQESPPAAAAAARRLPARLPACLSALQQSNSVGLVVMAENVTRPILIHRIQRNNAYQRSGGERGLPLLQAFRRRGCRSTRLVASQRHTRVVVHVLCLCAYFLLMQMIPSSLGVTLSCPQT